MGNTCCAQKKKGGEYNGERIADNKFSAIQKST